MDNTIALIVAIVAATPGLAAIIWQWRKDKRKQPTEDYTAAILAAKSASDAIKSYSDEVFKLRCELGELRVKLANLQVQIDEKDRQIEMWRIGINRLIGQLTMDAKTPVWTPEQTKGL